ncbi:PhoX family protein [Nocardiopsis nanhaiensis]
MAPERGPGEHRPSRRQALRATAGLGVLTAAALFGGAGRPAVAAPDTGSAPAFTAVPVAHADAVTVPPGYTARVLLPWGAPLRSDDPRWRSDATDTADRAARQVGTGHSGLHYLPLHPGHEGGRRGLLVVNHSWADPALLHSDGGHAATEAHTDKEIASLGVTVARVELTDGRWRVVDDGLNRRLTAASPATLSGPLADHRSLETGADPVGVVGGSAHAVTPWGTYLTGEDTLADLFGTDADGWSASAAQHAYGLTADSAYGWHSHRERFDLDRTPNEVHRFGWTVEVDPLDPSATPVKRTALGRLAQGGTAVSESRGRAVVYMSDRAHIYKFVGSHTWRESRQDPDTGPLDEGTLYAARFDSDGLGSWIPLDHGRSGLSEDDGFADQADVLLRAREAADAVGATEFPRPGGPSVHAASGTLYCPVASGPEGGRVLSWTEGASDHGAALFSWNEAVRAGSQDREEEALFAVPGGVHCGEDGRLWITTDVVRLGDGSEDGHERLGNSALLCADPSSGEVRRFLTGPRGCGIAGVTATPDQRALFVTVQGPGSAVAGMGSPTADDPRAVGNWPGFEPDGRPRSAVVVVRKDDGGIIGT